MKKEFVPYELAVKLKELGFNEPCLAYYEVDEGYNIGYTFCYSDRESQPEIGYSAPLYQQVFRWFREKYNYNHSIVFTKHPFGTDEYLMLSLQQPSRPTHFECEMKQRYLEDPFKLYTYKIGTSTNSQGQVELVGKYLT